jgi:hypothetical protein
MYRDTPEVKMQTSELRGASLNWAVGMANGWERYDSPFQQPDGRFHWTLMFKNAEPCMKDFASFEPSIEWAQGGPIIEQERISVASIDPHWQASMPSTIYPGEQDGPTPLIAAMRCYVASKLGDTVDIPQELAP